MITLIKKLLSMILSLIMLGAITTLCALFVLRNLLSGSAIVDLALKTANVGNVGYTSVLTELTGESSYDELSEYINDEELKENLENFISDTIKYYSGVDGAEVPKLEKIKEQVYESSKIYEEKTGNKVDYEAMEKAFDKLDEGIANNIEITTNEDVKKAFNFIYSDNILMLMIVLIISSLVLKFIIDRNIISLIKNIAIIALLNTFGNLGFGIALKKMFADNETVEVIVNDISSSFNKIAICSVVIAFVLLIIWFIIKIIKSCKSKEKNNYEIDETITDYNEDMEDDSEIYDESENNSDN